MKFEHITLKYTNKASRIKNFKGFVSFSIYLISKNLTIKKVIDIIVAITNIFVIYYTIQEQSYFQFYAFYSKISISFSSSNKSGNKSNFGSSIL